MISKHFKKVAVKAAFFLFTRRQNVSALADQFTGIFIHFYLSIFKTISTIILQMLRATL
jgi:hypothetical protein